MSPDVYAPWQQLVQHLAPPDASAHLTTACEHCQTTLPLFVSDELAGQPVDKLYPKVAHHLDLCSACLAEYAILSRLATAALYLEEFE